MSRSARRVPRSRLDGLWLAGEPVAAVRTITGVVVSIDGEDIITCTLSDGQQVSGILVLGAMPVVNDVVEIEVRGDMFVVNRSAEVDKHADDIVSAVTTANAAAAAATDAATKADASLLAANGKNKITWSLNPPGTAANITGDTWFQKESATQTVIAQWQGLGGTAWQQVTLNNQVIANLDAGKLIAGSAFTNALWVKTLLTLGDAAVNGIIKSYNFESASVGVYIDKNGLVAKGGSITGATIEGGTVVTGPAGTARARLKDNVLEFLSTANAQLGKLTTIGGGIILQAFGGAGTSLQLYGYDVIIAPNVGRKTIIDSALDVQTVDVSKGSAGGTNVKIWDGNLDMNVNSIQNIDRINMAWSASVIATAGCNIAGTPSFGSGFSVPATGTVLTNGCTFSGGPTIGGGPTITGGVTVTGIKNDFTGIPNARWNTSTGGILGYTSHANSSIRRKKDVETLDLTAAQMYGWRPVSYRLKDAPADRPDDFKFWGVIAEELADLGFESLIERDDDDRPDAVDYAKLVSVQQAAIRDLNTRVEALEARLAGAP